MYQFNEEDMKIIKGCLLTTKETFKCIPFKNKNIKKKIQEINSLLEKIEEGS